MAQKFYAFIIEKENRKGVVSSWNECQLFTKGKNSRYKSFKTLKEASDWLISGGIYEDKKKIISEKKLFLEEGIYFDAGTGRGIGVEVRITDKFGNSLLYDILPSHMINSFGNYLAPDNSTNNYGELIGCYLALKLALKTNILKIFGDSKLVIDYWINGFFNSKNLNEKTINLISKTKNLKIEFERLGGKILHISGDINPADLGFHK